MNKTFIRLYEKARLPPDCGWSPERVWERLKSRKTGRGYTLALVRQIIEAEYARPRSPSVLVHAPKLSRAASSFLHRKV